MIRLTRLNNQTLILNSDLIKSIEAAPDTVLTLVNGEKILVRESGDQVLERVIEFRRRLLESSPRILPGPAAATSEASAELPIDSGGKPPQRAGSES